MQGEAGLCVARRGPARQRKARQGFDFTELHNLRSLSVSQSSDKICLAVMRGTTRRLPIEIAWQGDAETTFDLMCSTYALPRLCAERDGLFARRCKRSEDGFVYLVKATSFDDSFFVYKVGVTKNLKERMQVHTFNPVLRWSAPVFAGCRFGGTAMFAETAMLASAAASGFWIGGEWIAGCSITRELLAVSKETALKDRRHRVRAN